MGFFSNFFKKLIKALIIVLIIVVLVVVLVAAFALVAAALAPGALTFAGAMTAMTSAVSGLFAWGTTFTILGATFEVTTTGILTSMTLSAVTGAAMGAYQSEAVAKEAKNAADKLEEQYGRKPTDEELAAYYASQQPEYNEVIIQAGTPDSNTTTQVQPPPPAIVVSSDDNSGMGLALALTVGVLAYFGLAYRRQEASK